MNTVIKEYLMTLVDGTVKVSFCEVDGEYHCTLLDFDILGTGASRDIAFEEMAELVIEYIIAATDEVFNGNVVRFWNPSTPEEWNVGEIKNFQVKMDAKIREEMSQESPSGHQSGDFSGIPLELMPV